ncbi:hypothetical protein ACQ5SO_02680 [Rhodovulum sp. DZ06]|uniref:hypothetical protein n=1 Tax=Rhodovulum sp. DZ06 TaxID=3425126 RepID=UPI003D33044C
MEEESLEFPTLETPVADWEAAVESNAVALIFQSVIIHFRSRKLNIAVSGELRAVQATIGVPLGGGRARSDRLRSIQKRAKDAAEAPAPRPHLGKLRPSMVYSRLRCARAFTVDDLDYASCYLSLLAPGVLDQNDDVSGLMLRASNSGGALFSTAGLGLLTPELSPFPSYSLGSGYIVLSSQDLRPLS